MFERTSRIPDDRVNISPGAWCSQVWKLSIRSSIEHENKLNNSELKETPGLTEQLGIGSLTYLGSAAAMPTTRRTSAWSHFYTLKSDLVLIFR